MTREEVEFLVFGAFVLVSAPFIILAGIEFVLNWRLARGRCLCGKKTPCHGGCR